MLEGTSSEFPSKNRPEPTDATSSQAIHGTGGVPRPKRKRTSPQARVVRAEYLDLAFGHVCEVPSCGCQVDLEQHHVDGDPSNNRLTNFRWRCKRHNVIESNMLRVGHQALWPSANEQTVGVRAGVGVGGDAGGRATGREALAETDTATRAAYDTTYQVNRIKEPMWLAYVIPLILSHDAAVDPLSHRQLIAMSAQHCDISTRTSERYLEKHSAPNGRLEVVHDRPSGVVFVRIRSSYWTPSSKPKTPSVQMPAFMAPEEQNK